MRNRMYGGVRGRKMKVGGKLLHFPPTRLQRREINSKFKIQNSKLGYALRLLTSKNTKSTNLRDN